MVHIHSGNVGAKQGIDPVGVHTDGVLLGHIVENINDAVQHFTGAQQFYQLTGTVHGGQGVHGVQALFKLGAGLGAHAQSQGGLANGGTVEVGGFKDHIHGVVHDFAVLTTHDAGQTHSPLVVGNDQHGGIELADIAVQGGQFLAVLGPADNDLAALDVAIIKGVHGLAVLQHDIVGDIHDIVDGTDAHGTEPLPHPFGGGGDLDIADHTGRVPGAQFRVGGFHIQQFHQSSIAATLDHRSVDVHGHIIGGGHLPGQTDDGKAVGTVGGDFKLHHMVVCANDGLDVVAGGNILLPQHKNAVGDAVRELRLLGVEVRQGTDGIVLGVVGHQIISVDVGADGIGLGRRTAQIYSDMESTVAQGLARHNLGGHHRTVNLVARLDVGGNGGLFLVQGLVIAQNGGGGDGSIGEIPLVQAQLGQPAEHAVGHNAAQLALLNFHATGQGGFVQGHGHQVAGMDVPCTGDDLNGLALASIHLADPHMVGVGMALHGQETPHNNIGNLRAQVLGGLHLGAGEGHGFSELFIISIHGDELAEPFSAQIHVSYAPFLKLLQEPHVVLEDQTQVGDLEAAHGGAL